MAQQQKKFLILLPLAWIYGLIQGIRNILYDSGIIKSQKASLKTIVIGNLAVGGTGKTPHVIWLAKELSLTHTVAILSRGYKRDSKGFSWVSSLDQPSQTGDEPLEMKKLLPDIPIAVDSNRMRALERMKKELNPQPDFVILDDGFQHRRLIPHYSIILSPAQRPYFSDYLLPAGRLREAKRSVRRCNTVIISHADSESPKDILNSKPYKLEKTQNLLTSSFIYSDIVPVCKEADEILIEDIDSVLLVTGIANPSSLIKHWESMVPVLSLSFKDHHNYTKMDISAIVARFNKMPGNNKVLITTGKDAVKLKQFPQICELPIFYQNRELQMNEKQKMQLLESILSHG